MAGTHGLDVGGFMAWRTAQSLRDLNLHFGDLEHNAIVKIIPNLETGLSSSEILGCRGLR